MYGHTKTEILADYAQSRQAIRETYDRHHKQFPELAARQCCADIMAAMRFRDARLASLKRKRQK